MSWITDMPTEQLCLLLSAFALSFLCGAIVTTSWRLAHLELALDETRRELGQVRARLRDVEIPTEHDQG